MSCCVCISNVIAKYEYNSAFEFIHDELDYCNQPKCDNNNKTKTKKYAIKKLDALDKIKDLSNKINTLAKSIQILITPIKDQSSWHATKRPYMSIIENKVDNLSDLLRKEKTLIKNFRDKVPHQIKEIVYQFNRKSLHQEVIHIKNAIHVEIDRREIAQREMIYNLLYIIMFTILIISSVWMWSNIPTDPFAGKLTYISDKYAIVNADDPDSMSCVILNV